MIDNVLPPELEAILTQCGADNVCQKMSLDTRDIDAHSLFVAMPGTHTDGRLYIKEAIARSAPLIVAEADGFPEEMQAPNVHLVQYLRASLGQFAHRFFDAPSRRMNVIAVTGTNGKTTISHTLANAFSRLGTSAVAVGTLGHGTPGRLVPLSNTTPDVISMHRLLAQHADAGVKAAIIEASSHGLDQGRLDGVMISTAIFTNLTRDHLDYHGSMEAYGQAKAKLLCWPGLSTAILNADDPRVEALSVYVPASVTLMRYALSSRNGVNVFPENVEYRDAGLAFDAIVDGHRIHVKSAMLGEFNLGNLLAVVAALWSNGVSADDISAALENMQPVAGRMQRVEVEGDNLPVAVVDYAHTPDALEQVLVSLRRHTRGKLVCVFGCGGNRDAGKRPLMAQAAERFSDLVIATSDNPRFEDPVLILEQVSAGFGGNDHRIIADRAMAIRTAIADAAAGDLVVIAGKGHEAWQEIAGEKIPFSDVEQVASALRARGGLQA